VVLVAAAECRGDRNADPDDAYCYGSQGRCQPGWPAVTLTGREAEDDMGVGLGMFFAVVWWHGLVPVAGHILGQRGTAGSMFVEPGWPTGSPLAKVLAGA
jgi:hypothetical protein